ncbi:MFS transporter [Candidatus Aerophobetes bacterium]|nr:MFS transporter [Candidatus Aerophobetes bacterium]
MQPHLTNEKLTRALFLTMLSVGLMASSLGPFLIPIAEFYQLDISLTTFPVVFRSIGFLIASIMISLFWSLGRAWLLFTISFFLIFVSSTGIFILHNLLEVVFVSFFLSGIGSGMAHSGVNSFLSETSGKGRVKFLNFSLLFYALGAFAGPMFVGVALTYDVPWYLLYPVLTLSLLFPAPYLLRRKLHKRLSSQREKPSHHFSNFSKRGKIIFSPLLWLLILATFFIMSGQISYFSFVPLFLNKTKDISAAIASYSVAIFWLCMIGGRAIYGRYLHTSDLSFSLIIGGLTTCLLTTLSFTCSGEILIILFIGLAGLFFSFISPGLMALAGNLFPRNIGFVTGIITACGGAGGMLLPWIIGIFSEKFGIERGVFLIPASIVAGTGILIYLRRYPVNKKDLFSASGS